MVKNLTRISIGANVFRSNQSTNNVQSICKQPQGSSSSLFSSSAMPSNQNTSAFHPANPQFQNYGLTPEFMQKLYDDPYGFDEEFENIENKENL
jgi:hypothetical protein